MLELANINVRFEEQDFKVVITSVEFVSMCRDKRKMHEFFKECNIKVAEEYAKDKIKLPHFIKPVDGSRSVETYTIRSFDDFKEYHFNNEKIDVFKIFES